MDYYLTCYDNDLIQLPGDSTAMIETDHDALAAMGGGGFLPRLQLFGANSEMVKAGKIPMAHWGLVRSKEQTEDLGGEVDILVITARVKALDASGDTVITVYDHKSDVFKSIMVRSEVAESKCMYGPEYLVYVPSAQAFATLFLSSATARRESSSLHARLKKAATCKSHLIKGKKHSWHGPLFSPCTTEITTPPIDSIVAEAEKFIAATKASAAPELASDTDQRAR